MDIDSPWMTCNICLFLLMLYLFYTKYFYGKDGPFAVVPSVPSIYLSIYLINMS